MSHPKRADHPRWLIVLTCLILALGDAHPRIDLVLGQYAPLPAPSLGYLTTLLGYGAPHFPLADHYAAQRITLRVGRVGSDETSAEYALATSTFTVGDTRFAFG